MGGGGACVPLRGRVNDWTDALAGSFVLRGNAVVADPCYGGKPTIFGHVTHAAQVYGSAMVTKNSLPG